MTRGTTLGLVGGIAAVAVWLILNGTPTVHAQGEYQAVAPQSDSSMGIIRLAAGDLGDHVVVVDPQTKVLCTYFVQRETGNVSLRSVRNLTWDMQLEEYNPSTPSPKDIRAVIEGQQ